MQISIDGAERLLLLALLKEHIQKQESKGEKPLRNCWNRDAGQSLIDRLSPTDWSDEIDVADYLLSEDDGGLYEVIFCDGKNDLTLINVAHPANVDLSDYVFTSLSGKKLRLPTEIPLDEIPRRTRDRSIAA